MIVKELIEKLKKCNQDYEIILHTYFVRESPYVTEIEESPEFLEVRIEQSNSDF